MLNVNNLSKTYGKMIANDNLSFTVNPGEIAVLLGPNGAGKSTAIKCIAGLLRFNGEISVCGHPNKDGEAKRMLGYVPEVPALYDMMSPAEHFEFISRAYSLENWQENAKQLISRFELTEHKDKMGKELSKGMRQKVSIACAMLPNPKVILLDEPMVGLDPHAIRELNTLIQEKRKAGVAILISTHILSSVDELWDKTLIMHKGRIVSSRERNDMEAGESLEELFFRITEGDGGEGDSE